MPHHGIAPSPADLAQETYLFDLVMSSLHQSGRGCGNCRTPFGKSALVCKNNPAPTETRGINRSAAVEHPVEGLGQENKLGPQTGVQGLEQGK